MSYFPIPEMLTTEDVAKHLKVTEETVIGYVKRSHNPLPAYKAGRVYRFDAQQVQEWLESTRVRINSLPLAAGE